MNVYTSVELCAGAGGQALGLEQAGFEHTALVEIESIACETLRMNRPAWNVIEADLFTWEPAEDVLGADLLAGGVPCPPFSHAGRQLGAADERNLFDRALDLTEKIAPRGVMIENVRGLLDPKFDEYRQSILARLSTLGYKAEWRLLQASDYGVSQLRPRSILVALRPEDAQHFEWPSPEPTPPTVGEKLLDLMSAGGWDGAVDWAAKASHVGPTLVGGSKKHGGPDLGPTRARRAWEALSVDGRGLADAPPGPDFEGMPRLTVRMAARIQGFPDDWIFAGKKTASYRQVGNAFPPPVAEAVGVAIKRAYAAADAEGEASPTTFGEPAQHALSLTGRS